MTKIAVIQTTNRTEGTKKVIDLLNVSGIKGKEVILKPNFNTADPHPASTSRETLKSLILEIQKMGAKSITIAERSGPADTEETFKIKGMYDLVDELGIKLVNLATIPADEYIKLKPNNTHWKDGFLFPKIYNESDCIIETCCLKTHQFGGHFTLSLKNAVGLVPRRNLDGNNYMRELHSSPNQRKMIAEINLVYKPKLIVLDGINAFVDGGPAKGTMKEPKVMIAGTDKIAVDAVGVAILRMLGTTPEVSEGTIFEQEQIARAVELGIGISSPEEIEFVTDKEETEEFIEKIMKEL